MYTHFIRFLLSRYRFQAHYRRAGSRAATVEFDILPVVDPSVEGSMSRSIGVI
jgi:hypothetical protein